MRESNLLAGRERERERERCENESKGAFEVLVVRLLPPREMRAESVLWRFGVSSASFCGISKFLP
jgi:hypothetical protein